MTVAVVICATGLFARAEFRTPDGVAEARAPFSFWTLLLSVWAAMNMVFLGGDLFNLYVALELLTFAAVPLVSPGRACGDVPGRAALSGVRAARLAAVPAR